MTERAQLYNVWKSMRNRCADPEDPSYKNYGARGITVCRRWMSFENFLIDMGQRPEGTSLDRRDNNKGYVKSNCRWATRFEQAQNKRNNRNLTYKGETHCLTEWARRIGIKRLTLWMRLKDGWPVARALTTPREDPMNRAQNHRIKFKGETHCIIAWEQKMGLPHRLLTKRIRRGWPIARALLTPARKYGNLSRT